MYLHTSYMCPGKGEVKHSETKLDDRAWFICITAECALKRPKFDRTHAQLGARPPRADPRHRVTQHTPPLQRALKRSAVDSAARALRRSLDRTPAARLAGGLASSSLLPSSMGSCLAPAAWPVQV